MRAVKSVSIDSERRVIITFLDGSTETLYPNCIWCDLEALRQLIKDLLGEKADAIVQTINNVTVATFEDGADETLIRKLLVNIDLIQIGEGDPSPENVRPIAGRSGVSVVRCGKNLIYKPFTSGNLHGLTIDSNDTTFHVSGMYTSSNNGVFTLDTILLKAGTYTLSGMPVNASDYGLRMQLWREGRTIGYDDGSGLNFSLSSDTTIYFRLYVNASVAQNKQVDIQVNMMLAISASEYEEAKGNSYSVNWQTEAGRVYGGTLDVVSGKLIVNKKLCKISDLTFTYNTQYGRFETTSLSSVIKLPPNNTTRLEGLTASIYTARLPSNTGSSPINNSIAVVTTGTVYIRDERYDNISDFITRVGDQTIMYPLAESVEYQLSAQEITTLLGVNNIFADSGNILELEYVADTKLYIGESQSGTLGSGRQSISNTDLQPVSEKTLEDVSEAHKAETTEKETQEETEDERGE